MLQKILKIVLLTLVSIAFMACNSESESLNAPYAISDQAALELGMTPVDEVEEPQWSDSSHFSTDSLVTSVSKALTEDGQALERFHQYANMAKVVVIIDKSDPGLSPTAQHVMIYRDGEYHITFPASTGSNKEVVSHSGTVYKTVTRAGIFRPERLYYEYDSSLWGGVTMNDATFLDTDGDPNRWNGTAIHTAANSRLAILGLENVSGGCINMASDDAGYIRVLIGMTGDWHNKSIDDESFESDKTLNNVMRVINRQRLVGTTIKIPSVDRWTGEPDSSKMVDSWDAVIVVRDFSK